VFVRPGVFFIVSPDKTSGGWIACPAAAQIMEAEKVIILALSRVPGCVRGLINVLIPTYFKCTFSGRNAETCHFLLDPQTHITRRSLMEKGVQIENYGPF
jgi:hypothetical protein